MNAITECKPYGRCNVIHCRFRYNTVIHCLPLIPVTSLKADNNINPSHIDETNSIALSTNQGMKRLRIIKILRLME